MGIETAILAASLARAAVSAAGTIAAGQAQRQNAQYQAKQLNIKAKEEQAAAFNEAQELKSQKERALSRHQALAAASGFMADDPSNLTLVSDIEERGTLQQLMAMYGGESRRTGLEAQALGTLAQGNAAQTGSYLTAGGTILGGIGDSMSKYYKMTT